MKTLLHNALIVTESKSFIGYIVIEGDEIINIGQGNPDSKCRLNCEIERNLEGKWILPGCIDDQVHFREPGLTHKGDIESESRAAIAGGVTSYMDMPNTMPQTTTYQAWKDKMRRGEEKSWANYAFFFGATEGNASEIEKLPDENLPGIKVFLGSSTGNMLVENEDALNYIFSLPYLIAIHSEDESIIKANAEGFKERYGDNVPISAHPLIRSTKACVESTRRALERAEKFGTKLHILHISTEEEAKMLDKEDIGKRNVTAEVCVHHLWFTDKDYDRLGADIKWNPAVKRLSDRDELRKAINDGRIQIVATDHAPHLHEEKQGGALKAASGGPGVQYSLLIMLELALQGILTKEKVVELMSANPAKLFNIQDRGCLKAGYKADLVIIDPSKSTIGGEYIISKCGWTPYQDIHFSHRVVETYVNGKLSYKNGEFLHRNAQPLYFGSKS